MSQGIETHHRLEEELHRLRLLRDLGDAEFLPEAEDAVLDELEAVWRRLTPEERHDLEVERGARATRFEPPSLHVPDREFPAIDVDAHARRLLPPRIAVGAA